MQLNKILGKLQEVDLIKMSSQLIVLKEKEEKNPVIISSIWNLLEK